MIARLIHWSIGNRMLVLLATLFITAWGIWSLRSTPLDALPDLSDTQVIIRTSFPGQAPQIIEHQVTYPLAEACYYVLPIALVDETFRQNGLTTANDIQGVPPAKLHDIFGADAALYITVTEYGTKYMLISSDTAVTASAKLVDLRTGTTLWTGSARASSEEGNNNGGGLVGMLITAAVKQVINSSTDAAHPIAGITSARLLSAGQRTGILYGPRNPKYGTD